MNRTAKSYKNFIEIFESLFDKLNKSQNTIFENMDYKPNVDLLYREFINSDSYQLYLEAEDPVVKNTIIKKWIVDNVFMEAYITVKHGLILEHETLPFDIEYKLNNSYNVLINESVRTAALGAATFLTGSAIATFSSGFLLPALGTAAMILAPIVALSDHDRKVITDVFKTVGEALGRLVTLNLPDLPIEVKKEVISMLKARDIITGEALDECNRIVGWNPSDSNKISRLIARIKNDMREYDYAQCVGTKLIKFHITMLEALYKILKASDVDNKIFEVMKGSLYRGAISESLFRNLARLTRNKNLYRLIEAINKSNEAINEMIDIFTSSKDPEYVRIGHDLSKLLDSEVRNLINKIEQEEKAKKIKPPLNRRKNEEVMRDRNRFDDQRNRNQNPFK